MSVLFFCSAAGIISELLPLYQLYLKYDYFIYVLYSLRDILYTNEIKFYTLYFKNGVVMVHNLHALWFMYNKISRKTYRYVIQLVVLYQSISKLLTKLYTSENCYFRVRHSLTNINCHFSYV